MMAERMTYRSKLLLALSQIVLFICVFVWNYFPAKTEARWLLSSRRYKSDVLSQPTSPIGELKHIEWDGWGVGRSKHDGISSIRPKRFA